MRLLGLRQKETGKGNNSKLFKRTVSENIRRAASVTEKGADGEGIEGDYASGRAQRSATSKQEVRGSGAGDPLVEKLLQGARSERVRAEFRALPASEYTEHVPVTFLVGTYNVNGRLPPGELDLSPWLNVASDPDIVAVAFQEIVPLNASNVVMGASLEAAAAWDRLIEAAINKSGPPSPTLRENGHVIIRSRSGSANLHDAAPDFCSLLDQDGVESNGVHADGDDRSLDLLAAFNQPEPSPPSLSNGHAVSNEASGPYLQVAAKQMVGLYLSVWVKRSLLPHVRGVQVTSVGTGVLGYMGNKGAVAARMRVYESGLCIVGAHLSAGESEEDSSKRNFDYAEIVRRCQFPPEALALDPETLGPSSNPQSPGISKVMAAARGPGQWGERRGLLDTDFTVWMGDLNYRLNIVDSTARALLRAGDLAALHASDELSTMLAQGRSFQGWAEGPLTFPPTYKFIVGTLRYHGEEEEDWVTRKASAADMSAPASLKMAGPNPSYSPDASPGQEEKKRRKPAWTDRVLWRPHPHLEQLLYCSANLTASDHKPVAAEFRLRARKFVRERVDAALDLARRAVDAQEMANLPRCELSMTQVEVGRVLYAIERTVHLILSNVSQVTANFEFVPQPGSMFGEDNDRVTRSTPRWATVYPDKGSLEPGEATEVLLRVAVTGGPSGSANLLALSGCKLDAILVLRVQGGNDIFCSVMGDYIPSFFGLSLSTLNALPRPLVPPDVTMEEAILARLQAGADINGRPPLPRLKLPSKEPPPDSAAPSHLASEFQTPATSVASSPLGTSEAGEDMVAEERLARRRRAFQLQLLGRTGSEDMEMFHQVERHTSLDLPSSLGPPRGLWPGGTPVPSPLGRVPVATAPAVPDLISLDGLPEPEGQEQELKEGGAAKTGIPPSAGGGFGGRRHARKESLSVINLLPQEVRALTDFLREKEHLATHGLFVNSAEQAFAAATEGPAGSRVPAPVRTIREALDRGLPIPRGATAHDVAATLLAFFAALPEPFMPPAAAQVCQVCVPPFSAASSLLADALSPMEWALFRHITGLMQEALSSPMVEKNGLSRMAVATLLADLWFEDQRLDEAFTGAGQSLTVEAIQLQQRMADNLDEVEQRRALFVSLFLDPSLP